jgi:epoxyqueuosine reductase
MYAVVDGEATYHLLGNRGLPDALPALVAALSDEETLVRGHAAWALGQIRTGPALDAVVARRSVESDDWVLTELHSATGAVRG